MKSLAIQSKANVFSAWGPNEPNNMGEENFAIISASTGEWNDVKNLQQDTVCWKKFDVSPTTVDSCNGENGIVEMKVTLRGHTGAYEGIDANGQGTFGVDQLTKKFEGNFLILEKVFGDDECTKISVDGVEVCSAVAEKITVQCKYSLAEKTIRDDFQITGQNTEAKAESAGTLMYNLEIDDDKNIGQEITFRITPVNSGLVFATIKSCDITKGDDKLTIIGHGADHCTNPIVGVAALTDNFSSDSVIGGKWTAFKWSTTSENNIESQGLECIIELSENKSDDPVENCKLEN